MRGLVLSIIIITLPVLLNGNPIDSTFTLDQLINLVSQNHPIARAINLGPDITEANVRQARGNFDPKLSGYYKTKQFKDSEYYGIGTAGLTIPTWFGVDAKVTYEQNDGPFLNPENTVPEDGLWYAGISVPLGNGLFMDQRRAQLQNARIIQNQAPNRQILELNDLLLDAIEQYYEWVGAHLSEALYRNAFNTAKNRNQGIVESAKRGELATIDTIESAAQARLLGVQLQQAELKRIQAQLKLNTYLWTESLAPLEINDNTKPPILDQLITWEYKLTIDELSSQLNDWQANHPSLQIIEQNIEQLLVERSLKREQLKPNLNVDLGLLSPNPTMEWNPSANYTVGLTFSAPILFRKERGALQETNLKIQAREWKLSASRRKLDATLQSFVNETETMNNQVAEWEIVASYYEQLLNAERVLFEQGESNLFLVNARELTYLKVSLNYIEMLVQFKTSAARLFWAGARLQSP